MGGLHLTWMSDDLSPTSLYKGEYPFILKLKKVFSKKFNLENNFFTLYEICMNKLKRFDYFFVATIKLLLQAWNAYKLCSRENLIIC